MNEGNNSIGSCYSDAVYSTSWPKTKPINVAEQLEKWNKVRQSLYSQNGWCSENVSQSSKWDVGDAPPITMQGNVHQHDGYETGTNIWNVNLSHQHGNEPYPPMQDPFFLATHTTDAATAAAAAAAASATLSINTPASQQLTQWEHGGAIPKMFNNNNNPTTLNCLSVTNAPNFEFPTPGSSSQQIPLPENQTATMFYDCDKMKSQPQTGNAEDALRLQFETMNLEQQHFCNETNPMNRHAPNLSNPISRNICANPMSNQYQVDCIPQAFL